MAALPASMTRALECVVPQRSFVRLSNLDEVKRSPRDEQTILWLDLLKPSEGELQSLAAHFDLHPLAVEDAMLGHQRPKVEEYDTFFFLVFYATDFDEEAFELAQHEIKMFLGRGFLITVHDDPLDFLDEVEKRWTRNLQQVESGVGILLYSLLDTIVDRYFPIEDLIVEHVDMLEEKVYSGRLGRDREFAQSVLGVKSALLEFRRITGPERDVLNVLTNRDTTVLQPQTLIYFRDIYDHLARVVETLDLYRDHLSSIMDAALSLTSNDLNKVMRTLTAASIILMTATLIAGIYGMNFHIIPELSWPLGYPFALALMLASAYGLFRYFKHIGWW